MAEIARRTAAALAAVAVGVGIAAPAWAAGLGGTLSGQVQQSEPRESYDVEMSLYGGVGNVSYPSLGCGGTLRLLSASNGVYRYAEHITSGARCADGGVITLRLLRPGDGQTWDWLWEGSGITVRGLVRGGVTEDPR